MDTPPPGNGGPGLYVEFHGKEPHSGIGSAALPPTVVRTTIAAHMRRAELIAAPML